MSAPFSSSSTTDSDDLFTAADDDSNMFGHTDDHSHAAALKPATTVASTLRHSRAGSRFALDAMDTLDPSASPASFAARRKRQSLFDEEDTEQVLSLVNKPQTPAAATTADEAATASTVAHTSAAAPSIALAAFSEAIPVDEDLAQMLASFSPSLQLELAGSSGASPSVSTSAGRVDELEFDRWGTAKSSNGADGALFSDLFGERGAAMPAASPSSSDGKIAHRKLKDSLYQVWPKDETGGGGGGGAGKVARTLKLTESELQALTLDGSVSKSFPYSDIFCVTCQETTRILGPPHSADDPSIAADGVVRSVSISFISDADLSYISPQAVQLSAELNERLSMRTSAEEPVAAANGAAAHAERLFDGQAYHEKLLAQQQQEPAAATSVDPTAVFFTPTNASSSSAPSSGSGGRGSVSASTSPVAAASAASSAKSETPKGSFAERAQKNGARSAAGAPNDASASPALADPAFLAWQARYALDQKVQSLIDRIWLDAASEEGKARSKFLKTSFPALESKPAALMASTRKFLDSFRTYMEKKRLLQLREAIVGTGKEGAGLLSEKEFESTFHARVERSAEVAVLLPILPRLCAVVAPLTRDADHQVQSQMDLLRGKSQSHFGIPAHHHSSSGWTAAIRELLQIDRFQLPADKLEVILGMVKCVYSTYKMEREIKQQQEQAAASAASTTSSDPATPAAAAAAASPASSAAAAAAAAKSNSSSMFLPADDLFPILIYIVSQSGLKGAATLKASLWGLCDPQQLQAEGGYYLTAFDAAIEYIRTVDASKPMDNTPAKKRR